MDIVFIDGLAYIKLLDGEPCDHIGCLHHISHPCERCGRIGGKGIAYIPYIRSWGFYV